MSKLTLLPGPWQTLCALSPQVPYRCSNGDCVSGNTSAVCSGVTFGVCGESDIGRFRCGDGTCVDSVQGCQFGCPDGYVQCWNGNCILNTSKCNPVPDCPPAYPIRCLDGSCAANQSSCVNVSMNCTGNQPFLCPNQKCAANKEACDCYWGCTAAAPYLCADGSCGKTQSDCYCTGTTSWRCSDGTCNSNITGCGSPYWNVRIVPHDQYIGRVNVTSVFNVTDEFGQTIVSVAITPTSYNASNCADDELFLKVGQMAVSDLRKVVHPSWSNMPNLTWGKTNGRIKSNRRAGKK